MRGRILRWALCVLYGLLGVAVPALGHSELKTAVPGPGAQLAASPQKIVLTFTQPLSTTSRVTLYGENFQPVSEIAATIDPANSTQIVASTPALLPGVYTVQWMAVALDRDVLTGSYTFAVVEQSRPRNDMLVISTVGAMLVALLLFVGVVRRYQRGKKGL